MTKQTEIDKIVRIHCKAVSICFRVISKHTNCVTYYDDVKRCVNVESTVVTNFLTFGQATKIEAKKIKGGGVNETPPCRGPHSRLLGLIQS